MSRGGVVKAALSLILALFSVTPFVLGVVADPSHTPVGPKVSGGPDLEKRLTAFEDDDGDFYAWTAAIPETRGLVLRTRRIESGLPEGSHGWVYLYSTVDADGLPAIGSSVVLLGDDVPAAPRNVVLWESGTAGLVAGCAPSIAPDYASSGLHVAMLAQGWAVVAPDYLGLGVEAGASYLLGEVEGAAALDAVAALQRELPDLLAADVVVMGHSQGGHAALWANALAASGQSSVSVVGTVALAPVTNVTAWVDWLPSTQIGLVFRAYILQAYAETYPEVTVADYVSARNRAVVDGLTASCVGPATDAAYGMAEGVALFSRSVGSGAMLARLVQNTPHVPVGGSPVLVLYGAEDRVVPPDVTTEWAAGECASGAPLDARELPGEDHSTVLWSPYYADQVISWAADAFAHRVPSVACG